MTGTTLCDCDRGYYDPDKYRSCYECYLDRKADFLTCIFCGRWHHLRYATCFKCRTTSERDEAATALRQTILARDGHRCHECGAHQPLQIDHVIPCAKGGTARPWNLLTRCLPCNLRKGSTWFPGCRYENDRELLLRAYFTYLRSYLTDEERTAVRADVEAWRLEHLLTLPDGRVVRRYPPLPDLHIELPETGVECLHCTPLSLVLVSRDDGSARLTQRYSMPGDDFLDGIELAQAVPRHYLPPLPKPERCPSCRFNSWVDPCGACRRPLATPTRS